MLDAAHEIRNFLTVINGYCDLGLQAKKPPRDCFARIQEASDHIEQTLKDLFQRSMAGHGRLDLNAIVRPLAQAMIALPGPELETRIELQQDLPLGPVGDAGAFFRALLNLCLNARKAMSAGGVLTISTCGDDGWVIVNIADTGCGFSPAELDKLRKWCGSNTEHGRGLLIVKRTVESVGGRLEVTSVEGEGTRFVIALPVFSGTISTGLPNAA